MLPRHQNVLNYIAQNVGKDARILELGCHKGHLLNELFKSGYRNLDCVDIENYLEYPEVRKLSRFYKIDLNKSTLPFENETFDFDIVCALQTLEHLENPHQFERECARVLKLRGKLVISMPHGHNLASKIRFFLRGNICRFEKDNEHIAFFTKNIFHKIFLKDFKLIKVMYSRGFLSDFGLSIHTPDTPFFNKLFGRNVYYFLEKRQYE